MITLRVVLEDLAAPRSRAASRYSSALTSALVAYAPRDCEVKAVTSAASDDELSALDARLPGLAGVHRLALPRRELRAAWQYGISTLALPGMVHATSLLAPLTRHDRRTSPGNQVVVTIPDASAWHPSSAAADQAAWTRHMAKRAQKHADAIVVPSHATADALSEFVDFGDRVRVIPAAGRERHAETEQDAPALRRAPSDYVLAVGAPPERRGFRELLRATAAPDFPDVPLVVASPPHIDPRSVEHAIAEAGVPAGRVVQLTGVSEDDVGSLLTRALLFVEPDLAPGFGLRIDDALKRGRPVLHCDDPALLELTAGAAAVVERAPDSGYPDRLTSGIATLLADDDRRSRLAVLAEDRARAFSWRSSAELVWQLHADL